MNHDLDLPYWIALAHNLPNWKLAQINHLVAQIIVHKGMSLADFFECQDTQMETDFWLRQTRILELRKAVSDLTSLKMRANALASRRVHLLPVLSHEYPKLLRKRLELKYSPTLFYAFGNLEILQRKSWTVIGTRAPAPNSIDFAKMIGEVAAFNQRAIVCGFAKGIDQIALAETLHFGGIGIAILPYGLFIQTYRMQPFRRAFEQGRVLFLSSFEPFSPFSGPNAIVRNRWLCNLGEDIIVPESNTFGGTWLGANKALAEKRSVYVRKPNPQEENGNQALIQAGGIQLETEKLLKTIEKIRNTQVEPKPARAIAPKLEV